jgi:HEAT repeat protein
VALTHHILQQGSAAWRFDWLSALVGVAASVFLALFVWLLWRLAGSLWALLRVASEKAFLPVIRRHERRYLARVADLWRAWRVGLDAAPIDEAFVPLRLAPLPRAAQDLLFESWGWEEAEILRRYHGTVTYGSRATVDLVEALSLCQQILLLGGPGSGKTSILAYLGLTFAQGASERVGLDETRLPVYVSLPRLMSTLPVSPSPLTDADRLRVLAAWLAGQQPEGSALVGRLVFRRALRMGRCLFLLDEAGQVALSERSQLAEWLHWLATYQPQNRVIVAGDPAAGVPSGLDLFRVLEVMPPDPLPAQTLVESRLRQALEDQTEVEPEVRALWRALVASSHGTTWQRNPLALSLAAVLHARDQALPASWTELVGMALDLSFRRVAEKNPALDSERCWDLAADLALDVFLEGHHTFRHAGLLHRARAQFGGKRRHARACLESLVSDVGLLMPMGGGELRFSHRVLAAYLAAWRLAVDGKVSLAMDHIDDPTWRTVVLVLCGLAPADEIVQRLTDGEDDLFRSRLLVASECLAQQGPLESGWAEWISRTLAESLMKPYQCSFLRKQSALALARVGGSATGHILAQGLRSDDVHLRRISALGVGMGSGHRTLEALSTLMTDRDWVLRMIAAQSLRYFPTREALGLLVEALTDETEEVQMAAAQSLALSGLEGLKLAEQALDHRDPLVRRAAVRGVAALGPAYARPVLTEIAEREREWSVNAAIEALEQRWSADHPILQGLLGRLPLYQESWLVRWSATRGQTVADSEVALQMLRRALEANEWLVRAAAAEALGQRGGEAAIQWLQPLLEDPVLEVRDAAYQALRAVAWRSGAAIPN